MSEEIMEKTAESKNLGSFKQVYVSENGKTELVLEVRTENDFFHRIDDPNNNYNLDIFTYTKSIRKPYLGSQGVRALFYFNRDTGATLDELCNAICRDENSILVADILNKIEGNPIIDKISAQIAPEIDAKREAKRQYEIDNSLLARARKKITKGTFLEDIGVNDTIKNTLKAKIEKPISDRIVKAKERLSQVKKNYDNMDAFSQGLFLGCLTMSGIGTVGAISVIVSHYNDISEATTLKEASLYDEATTKLFKAAFENNLDDFKDALKNKADIKTPNKHNQNVLMVALARGSYDISGYILTTPELRDKIDYKQADDKGITAIDIIQSKVDYALHKTGRHESPEESTPELMMAKRVITEQLQKQNQEEAKGQARSNTKYDAFSRLMKNNGGNTGL